MSITETISQFPPPPDSANDTPEQFNAKADDFVDHQANIYTAEVNTLSSQMNSTAQDVNEDAQDALDAANASASSANFKGEWSISTNYNIPSSVLYNGVYYNTIANSNIGNTPGTSPDWAVQSNIPIGAIQTLTSPLSEFPMQNSTDIQRGVGSVTTTRSTTATVQDRYGDVKTLAVDEIGFNEDGILIEGESTNILPNSNDMANATYWIQGVDGAVITPNDVISPEGTVTANRLNLTAQATSRLPTQLSITGGITYLASVYVLGSVGTNMILALSSSGGTYIEQKETHEFTGVWQRITVQLTTNTDNTGLFLAMERGTNFDYYAWGAQVESLPYASSYIPTTTTAVTRTASLTTATAYDNIPNLNEDWSMSVEVTINGKNTDQAVGQFLSVRDEAGATSIFYLRYINETEKVQCVVYNGSQEKSTTSSQSQSIGESARYTATFNRASNTMILYKEGTQVGQNLSVDFEIPNKVGVIKLNGWSASPNTGATPFISLKNIKFYDKTLTAEEARL